MSNDYTEYLGQKLTIEKMKFHISEDGFVRTGDGEELGHIEECLEEGKVIMDLMELLHTIPLAES